MAVIGTPAVLKIIITDDKSNNVQIEFNGGTAPVDAIIASLEIVLEKLKESPQSKDRTHIN
jgi:hypothetical protein